MTEKFDKSYFVGGSKSNFTDYRTKKFEGLARDLVENLKIIPEDSVLDWGAGTGGLMHALNQLGINNVQASDISLWAVQYGRENFGFSDQQLQYYNLNLLSAPQDWILSLDVFEHMPQGELERCLSLIERNPPRKGVITRIPVSAFEGRDFILDVSKNDRTHVSVHCKLWWDSLFHQHGLYFIKSFSESNIYESDGVLARHYGGKKWSQ